MSIVSAKQESIGGDGFGKKRSILAATNGKKVVATGGSITTSGSYTIHTFTSSGSFVVESAPEGGVVVEYLVIGGGGGGGNASDTAPTGAGGGGAGGFRTSVPGTTTGGGSPSNIETKFIAEEGRTYTVTVGAGGAATANGSNSSISNPAQGSITAFGGGFGGSFSANAWRNITQGGQQQGTHSAGITKVSVAHGADNPAPTQIVHLFQGSYTAGAHGGSGGGGASGRSQGSFTGGNFRGVGPGGLAFAYSPTVYASQGYPGGDSRASFGSGWGGGGGGAGSTGYPGWVTPNPLGLPGGAPSNALAGFGGNGLASSISGSSVTYAGGGSRGTESGSVIGPAPGGGGTGAQAQPGINAQAGTANRGAGGGGGAWNNPGGTKPGAAGGSGIVILRYIA